MNRYEIDTVIKFSNGKVYGVTSKLESEGKSYLCLATLSDPLEIIFAEVVAGTGELKVVNDQREKEKILYSCYYRHSDTYFISV